MQNKSFTWIFVILLTLAVAYQLSYGVVASSFEKKVHQMAVDSIGQTGLAGASYDSAVYALERKMLRDSSDAKVYPLMGHTYSYLKQNELSLGLDLKGGMSVTLEVSIPDMIMALSDYNQNPNFLKAIAEAREAQKSSSDDYITLFEKSWKNNSNGTELWNLQQLGDSR
jgi:SecD/SecF fusion protein